MWHVSSRSGVATLRTAIHFLLTYPCSCLVESLLFCSLRFDQFLQYFGYSAPAIRDVKVGAFCRTMSDFALEYQTTRDRVIHQRQKKATQRQRNMTRGKMIVEVSRVVFVCVTLCVACWCNGYGVGSQHKRSRVRLPAVPLSSNNLGQVVHTRVPLTPSSIIRYRSRGGDALRLGR